MERKTLKKLLLGIAMLGVGIGLFSVGVTFSAPVVGLLGTFLIIAGGLDTGDYIRQGIKEKIEYNKFYKQRKQEIAEKNKQKQAEKNLVVSDFKSHETLQHQKTEVCEVFKTNSQENEPESEPIL